MEILALISRADLLLMASVDLCTLICSQEVRRNGDGFCMVYSYDPTAELTVYPSPWARFFPDITNCQVKSVTNVVLDGSLVMYNVHLHVYCTCGAHTCKVCLYMYTLLILHPLLHPPTRTDWYSCLPSPFPLSEINWFMVSVRG